jgi:hypothetical protein
MNDIKLQFKGGLIMSHRQAARVKESKNRIKTSLIKNRLQSARSVLADAEFLNSRVVSSDVVERFSEEEVEASFTEDVGTVVGSVPEDKIVLPVNNRVYEAPGLGLDDYVGCCSRVEPEHIVMPFHVAQELPHGVDCVVFYVHGSAMPVICRVESFSEKFDDTYLTVLSFDKLPIGKSVVDTLNYASYGKVHVGINGERTITFQIMKIDYNFSCCKSFGLGPGSSGTPVYDLNNRQIGMVLGVNSDGDHDLMIIRTFPDPLHKTMTDLLRKSKDVPYLPWGKKHRAKGSAGRRKFRPYKIVLGVKIYLSEKQAREYEDYLAAEVYENDNPFDDLYYDEFYGRYQEYTDRYEGSDFGANEREREDDFVVAGEEYENSRVASMFGQPRYRPFSFKQVEDRVFMKIDKPRESLVSYNGREGAGLFYQPFGKKKNKTKRADTPLPVVLENFSPLVPEIPQLGQFFEFVKQTESSDEASKSEDGVTSNPFDDISDEILEASLKIQQTMELARKVSEFGLTLEVDAPLTPNNPFDNSMNVVFPPFPRMSQSLDSRDDSFKFSSTELSIFDLYIGKGLPPLPEDELIKSQLTPPQFAARNLGRLEEFFPGVDARRKRFFEWKNSVELRKIEALEREGVKLQDPIYLTDEELTLPPAMQKYRMVEKKLKKLIVVKNVNLSREAQRAKLEKKNARAQTLLDAALQRAANYQEELEKVKRGTKGVDF